MIYVRIFSIASSLCLSALEIINMFQIVAKETGTRGVDPRPKRNGHRSRQLF